MSNETFQSVILAVDDDPLILDTVAKFLTSKELRVVTTTDPEKVVEMALKEKPRLILSDIAMPGIDGLTLLKLLKQNVETRNIPLILLTSSQAMEDIEEGLNTGAEAYLVKPIDWTTSWPKIQAVLLRS